MRMAPTSRLTMAIPFLVVLLTVLVDITRAQLNLPDMPGPPYPDRFGNNRWGVKYNPGLHGRGGSPSHHQSSSASSPDKWRGSPPVQDHPPRYRGGGGGPPGQSSSRGKWASGLKPLVSSLSKFKDHSRKRRPYFGGGSEASSSMFDPTSDSFYRNPYTSKSIDRYVKNYLKHYNSVSRTPSATSDLVNIQNFREPKDLSVKFRPRNFVTNGNRPNDNSDSTSSVRSSNSNSYARNTRYSSASPSSTSSNNQPLYRTYNYNPQESFSGGSSGSQSSKTTISRSSNNNFAKTLSNFYNDYEPGGENSHFAMGSSAASSDAISNAIIVTDDSAGQYNPPPLHRPSSRRKKPSAVRTKSSLSGRPLSYYNRLRPPPPINVASRPLSALEMYEDSKSGYSPGPGPIKYSPGGGMSYSGPPVSSLYDSYGLGPGPYTPVAPLLSQSSPVGHDYFPSSSDPYSYPSYPTYKSKHNKNRLQHTPMNVLRGLFGRGERDYKRAPANLPYLPPSHPHQGGHRGPPPQFSYNPLLNSLTNGLDFMRGQRDPFGRPPLSLGNRDRPQRPQPPAAAPDAIGENQSAGQNEQKEHLQNLQNLQNWPRIFTAMGSGVDAIAGGIHAVRKEVSKMTGQAVAKGLMMGGSAVNEVSKGMASVITKMSHI